MGSWWALLGSFLCHLGGGCYECLKIPNTGIATGSCQLETASSLALCMLSWLNDYCWWVNWGFKCNCSHTALQTDSLFIFNEALCLFFSVQRLLARFLIIYIKCGRRFVHRQVMQKTFGLGLQTHPLGFESDSLQFRDNSVSESMNFSGRISFIPSWDTVIPNSKKTLAGFSFFTKIFF